MEAEKEVEIKPFDKKPQIIMKNSDVEQVYI